MQKPYTLHSLQKRILAISLTLLILACALGIRLFIVQIINGKELQIRATDQWTRDLPLVAPRGTIYDSTGDTLAVSYTTYNVYVRGREVTNAEDTARKLSDLLDLNYESTLSKVSNKNISESLLKMQVESELAEQIYALSLDGVFLSENVGRYYVYGDLLTQLMGFTSIDNTGQSGVEAYFDDYLTGVDGYSYVQSDLQGKEIGGNLRYYVQGVAGDDLTLTINSKIQIILEQILQQAYTEQQAKSVSGIVMEAKTGKILAISSKPSFDLNDVPRDDLTTLFQNSRLTSVTDTYEPGSTFKILTVAAALEEGLTSLDDTFYCPGYRIIDGQKIKCWKTVGHGNQMLAEAFSNSCNCCFMDLALRLGVDKFYEYAEKFGLGEKTGITVSGESSGILMQKENVKTVDLARMGFGHAIAVTPIQLLSIVSAITNGGVYHTPTTVEKAVDVYGNTTYIPSIVTKQIISSETSAIINTFLKNTTNKTGDYTFVEGYNIGGKTGTAQKYNESGGIAQGKYISSFIGTYPADNPEYIFMIMVDEPSAGAYYGSIVAQPYGKIFFEELFAYLGTPKDDPESARVEVIMPNVEGMSLANALATLKTLNLYCEVEGEGGTVTKQLPPAGTICYEGETILISTS